MAEMLGAAEEYVTYIKKSMVEQTELEAQRANRAYTSVELNYGNIIGTLTFIGRKWHRQKNRYRRIRLVDHARTCQAHRQSENR